MLLYTYVCSQCCSVILSSTHILFAPCQSTLQILIWLIETWPWKTHGQLHGYGQRKSHIAGPVSSWCGSFSFHINWRSNSWDRAIQNFKLMVQVKGQDHKVDQTSLLYTLGHPVYCHRPLIPLPQLSKVEHKQFWRENQNCCDGCGQVAAETKLKQ